MTTNNDHEEVQSPYIITEQYIDNLREAFNAQYGDVREKVWDVINKREGRIRYEAFQEGARIERAEFAWTPCLQCQKRITEEATQQERERCTVKLAKVHERIDSIIAYGASKMKGDYTQAQLGKIALEELDAILTTDSPNEEEA